MGKCTRVQTYHLCPYGSRVHTNVYPQTEFTVVLKNQWESEKDNESTDNDK